MTGTRDLSARWHHLMCEASDVVDVALAAGVPVRSIDVSPDRSLGAPGPYPEIVVWIDDAADVARLAAELGLPVPVRDPDLGPVEISSGRRRGVAVNVLGALVPAGSMAVAP